MESVFKNVKVQVFGFWLIALVVSFIVASCCGKKLKTFSSLKSIAVRDTYQNVDSIQADSFGLYFSSEVSQVAQNNVVDFSLLPSAYATQCYSSNKGRKETVVSMQIFTDKTFDAAHPAGSEVSSYFYLDFHYYLDTVVHFTALPDLDIEILNSHFYNDIRTVGETGSLYLFLKHRPLIADTFTFRTIVTLSDGRRFDFLSPAYKLY